MNTKHLLSALLIFPFSLWAAGSGSDWTATSALQFQQQSGTRISVEESNIRFFTGGLERITLDASGNVGIGTTTLLEKVAIRSSNDDHKTITFGLKPSSNDNTQGGLGVASGGFVSLNAYNHIVFNTDGGAGYSEKMRIDVNGKVGIGTTDPGNYQLNVTGSTLTTGAVDIASSRPTNANAEGLFLYGGYNTSFQLTSSGWGASHAILFDAYKNASQPAVGGLLGTGNAKFTHGAGPYGGGAGMINFYGNGGTMDFVISPISTGAGNDINWGAPKMRIQRDGTIGINTSDPDENYKLHVNGAVRAISYKSDANSYADFVFDDDYKLPTLKEVETFIEKNHHLPNIPSEAEAKANGVDLQEMQAKLLQKIEELTLYVIAQQKEIETLKTQINK